MPAKFKPTRQRKHKVLARQNGNGAHGQSGSLADHANTTNALIVTESKSVREQRRQQLREELREQQRKPQISAKKQKRLDKYIENKLKKEENLDLVKKLEQEKLKYDARGLQSSKNLKKRAFDQYVEGQVSNGDDVVVEEVRPSVKTRKSQKQEDSDNDSEDSFEETHRDAFTRNSVAEPVDDAAWFKNKPAVTSGGTGLAQPLAIGPDGLPIIPSRNSKRLKQPDNRLAAELPASIEVAVGQDEEPWEGFSSEAEPVDDDSEASDASDLEDSSSESGSDDASDDASEDSATESTSASEDLDNDRTKLKTRSSAFKIWATQRVNESIGHTPSYSLTDEADGIQLPSTGIKPAAGYRLGVEDIDPNRPKQVPHVVQVARDETIDESRSQLPVLQREQEIMEAINHNPVIVLKGETGSGKTTQIPQFLYEAGYGDPNGPNPGMIGITQPRRVAAVSMAKRVAEELGSHGTRVAHQIRFDTTVSSNTAVKFMTDGVLLRELSQDLLLKKYSVIVIDEAHERSSNTDILIGMLSKIVPARMKKTAHNPDPKPLKLIIMSATLNVADFLHEKLFDSAHRPPVVEAEGRQHRVTTHFALRSRPDYVEETIEKVKRAHRKLPRGGMLVFLTGQNEIKQVLGRLRTELRQSSSTNTASTPSMHISGTDAPLEFEDFDIGLEARRVADDDFEDDIKIFADEETADEEFEISDTEDDDSKAADEQNQVTSEELLSGGKPKQNRDPYDTVHILPLYSQLPTTEQLRVFEAPPERARLIVLATNVAETSLTIPGIRYVFDCGRGKERNYNVETNVQSFDIDYISKASAQQRAGRAGRTGPGHCWRLYSSAIYEQYFPEHTEPEILRMPAESIVLQLKSFKYPKPVIEFPFPSAPSASTLQQAEKLLRNLGALHGNTVTELGKSLSTLPIAPRLGKIVATALKVPKVLLEAILLVSVLSVDDIFISNLQAISEENDDFDDDLDARKQQYGRVQATLSKSDKTSDMLKMYTALVLYAAQPEPSRNQFCTEHYLRPKAMLEAHQLSTQLRRLVQASHPGSLPSNSSVKASLSSTQSKTLNAVGSSGYTDQIAIRHDLHPTPPILERKPRRAIDVPYLPLTPLNKHITNSTPISERAVFIHPTSVLSRLTISSLPPFVIYRHLQRSQPSNVTSATKEAHMTKTRMLPLTPVHSAKDLLELVKDTSLIQYGKPVPKTQIEEIPGKPKRRVCWVTCEVRDRDAATNNFLGTGWPLPPIKVRQVMDLNDASGWRVEEILA